MSRKVILDINKTNKLRISKWWNNIKNKICNSDEFKNQFDDLILSEVKNIKECSEKVIVQTYLDKIELLIDNLLSKNDKQQINWELSWMNEIIVPSVRLSLSSITTNSTFDNIIDIYFNDVKREYIKHPMVESNNLEFLPENRDIFIKNNLKLVINCAKRYRNLGLPFEDLIQIGNMGLLKAFEKFDTDRANLRQVIIKKINESQLDKFDYEDVLEIVRSSFTYDTNLNSTLKLVPVDGFNNKEEFFAWANKNIKTAVFASVAFHWIRAYILSEIAKYNQLFYSKKSKRVNNKNEDEEVDSDMLNQFNETSSNNVFYIDDINPYNDNMNSEYLTFGVANDKFMYDENNIDKENNYEMFQEFIYKILNKLNVIDRRIIKKRFGIGVPLPLSVQEIADSEALSVARVKYIISNALKHLNSFISDEERNYLNEFI